MSDEGKGFHPTKEYYTMICHECGYASDKVVSLGGKMTYICTNCDVRWQAGDRENCVECGKRLGSTTAICHGCFSNE